MTPRMRTLTLDEVARIQKEEKESWQEQLKDVARGKTAGFVIEVVAEEIPGYGVLPEQEFKKRLLNETHRLWNAVKHRLVEAAEAAGDGEKWGEWVMVRRRDALVRVYRVLGEGDRPKEMPKAFVDKILSAQVRTARSTPRELDRVTTGRDLVERRPGRHGGGRKQQAEVQESEAPGADGRAEAVTSR